MSTELAARRTRRAVLASVVAGVAAMVGHALGRPISVRAADGDPIIIGQQVSAEGTTTVRNTTTHSPVFIVHTDGNGVAIAGTAQGTATSGVQGIADQEYSSGVRGSSVSGIGVAGASDHGVGLYGSSPNAIAIYGATASLTDPAVVARGYGGATGLLAFSGDATAALPDAPLDTAVLGYAAGYPARPAANAVGVYGRSTVGTGVLARADAGGTALQVDGRAAFSQSGRITVLAGRSRKTKLLPGLTSDSVVFAVVQAGDGGVWVRSVSPATDRFTVVLNRTVSVATTVGWIAFG